MLLALALHASTARAGTPAGFGGTPGVINENTPHYDLEPLYHDGKAQLSAGAGVPASRSAREGGATRPAAPRPSSVATAGRGRAPCQAICRCYFRAHHRAVFDVTERAGRPRVGLG